MRHVSSLPLLLAAILLAALPTCLAGQAIAEYALGTARVAGGAAAMKGVSKGINGALDNVNKSLQGAGKTGQAQPAHTSTAKPQATPGASRQTAEPVSKPAPAPVSYEDPAGIKPGLLYAELIHRFGPPSVTITTGSGNQSLSYIGKDRSVDVECRDDKVISVDSH